MSIISRTGKKLLADYHRVAELMWFCTLRHEKADAHRHAAAKLFADVAKEILRDAADRALKTGKIIEQTINIEGVFFGPVHYEEVRVEFRPTLRAMREKSWDNGMQFSVSHKDGEFCGLDPLTLSVKFMPPKYCP